jgi:imidazoleglycerol-phosphate dehydratase
LNSPNTKRVETGQTLSVESHQIEQHNPTLSLPPYTMPSHHHPSARFNADLVICEDLAKPSGPIQTGVGFLDHMIDQLNSHAQIGVSLVIGNFAVPTTTDEETASAADINRHKNDQEKLMRLVGSKLGSEIRTLVAAAATTPRQESHFSCPLDEALVECRLQIVDDPSQSHQTIGNLTSYTLPPYGKYCRTHIGCLETEHLVQFWSSLAEASGLKISLAKIRGRNAHHIVESSFKAFSRALRNLLDGVDTKAAAAEATSHDDALDRLYGPISDNWKASVALQRKGTVHRQTKETSISVSLSLDGGDAGQKVSTGVATLDTFLSEFAVAARLSLQVQCAGDLWIDEHHTAEDVSIALGQVVNDALGTKAGLNRMWSCTAASGTSVVQVVMDLSNRPDLAHNLFEHSATTAAAEMAGDLSLEMMEHVLESFAVNARMTVHVVELERGDDPMHTIRAVAKALGAAFFYCTSVDLRRAGSTASSKGTLSV